METRLPLFVFGAFELDPTARRLTRGGAAIPVADRHFDVLLHLVAHAGAVQSKDALVAAAWQDVAVTDNSLEQAISSLRRALGSGDDGEPLIRTVPRRGYCFTGRVTRASRRESDDQIDALLAPHRAFLEGRAAVETLDRAQLAVALDAFMRAVTAAPEYAPAHVGLANASIFIFESTRADPAPDVAAVSRAIHHAREACRLDAGSAEPWATLALALHRGGDAVEALAAARRAVDLEPDNWKHHLRLAFVGWGEERLRAADRTLKLLPGVALAHWLRATVDVARQSFDAAERELDAGTHAQDAQGTGAARFGGVGLHWLRGLVYLDRGDGAAARDEFERELAFEQSGHLYARECAANTWYSIGAMRWRAGDRDAALAAFAESLRRVHEHAVGLAAAAALARSDDDRRDYRTRLERRLHALRERGAHLDAALVEAVHARLTGDRAGAMSILREATNRTPQLGPLWLLPIEPALHVSSARDEWAPLLAIIRSRAA